MTRFAILGALCVFTGCNTRPAVQSEPTVQSPPPATDAPASSTEDERLLAADPKTLSREDRRRRAYALRRKIMQDPESPAARTLTDLVEAHERGDIDPKARGPVFTAHGQRPTSGAPPAGVRAQ